MISQRGRGPDPDRRRAPGWLRPSRPVLRSAGLRCALAAPATLLVVGLIAFHAEILWRRLASMTLLEPPVALRWGLSAAALVGLLILRRAGVSLLRDRKALAFWLAVLLIHVSFPVPPGVETATALEPGPAAALLVMVPATATLSLIFGLALALQATGTAAPAGGGPRPSLPKGPFRASTFAESYPHLLSRPPPA